MISTEDRSSILVPLIIHVVKMPHQGVKQLKQYSLCQRWDGHLAKENMSSRQPNLWLLCITVCPDHSLSRKTIPNLRWNPGKHQ